MQAYVLVALTAWVSHPEAGPACLAQGEPIHWVADYCMLQLGTDDEIAVSGCIAEQRKVRFVSDCASNRFFKTRMCELLLRQGSRTGALEHCINDPAVKGSTVRGGGVGAPPR